MRRILFGVFCCALFASLGTAQPLLSKWVGVRSAPNDADSICTPGPYGTDFSYAGLHVGDRANDFTLFDDNGDSVSLAEILARGKPVLLVSGSYTCPVFRYNVPTLNKVIEKYGDYINAYVVYAAEAHPVVDASPYGTGDPYSDFLNQQDRVQYPQSKTYGERRAMLEAMTRAMQVDAPILLDAPCNQWLEAYGPAPNAAYIIDPNGTVRYKEPWFNLNGSNIYNDLDELLSIDTGRKALDTGRVTFELLTNDTVFAPIGSTTSVTGRLVNESDAAAITVISRHNSMKMPIGWKSAICTNVCLSPSEDTAIVRLEPHTSQDVRIYIYLGQVSGTGRVYVHINNVNVPEDSFKLRVVCVATTLGVATPAQSATPSILCVPNPVASTWAIRTDLRYAAIRIYDVLGRFVATYRAADTYPAASLPAGAYRLQLVADDGSPIGLTTLVKQ